MLKLKLQYIGHLMGRADSLEKTLMLGKTEGKRRSRRQRMRWLDGITHLIDMDLSKLGGQWRTGNPGMLQSAGSQRVRHDWATEQPQQWRAVQAPRNHFHPLYITCTWVCTHVHTQENSAKRRVGCRPNRQSNKFCFSSFSCTHKICRRVLQLWKGENSGEASRKHLYLNLLLLL